MNLTAHQKTIVGIVVTILMIVFVGVIAFVYLTWQNPTTTGNSNSPETPTTTQEPTATNPTIRQLFGEQYQLAYVVNNDIFIGDDEGNSLRLVKGNELSGQLELSVGKYPLLYLDKGDLYTVTKSEGKPKAKKLTKSGGKISKFSVSPQKDKLIYITKKVQTEPIYSGVSDKSLGVELTLLDLTSDKEKIISSIKQGTDVEVNELDEYYSTVKDYIAAATFAPNGKDVLYYKAGLNIYNLESKKNKQIVEKSSTPEECKPMNSSWEYDFVRLSYVCYEGGAEQLFQFNSKQELSAINIFTPVSTSAEKTNYSYDQFLGFANKSTLVYTDIDMYNANGEENLYFYNTSTSKLTKKELDHGRLEVTAGNFSRQFTENDLVFDDGYLYTIQNLNETKKQARGLFMVTENSEYNQLSSLSKLKRDPKNYWGYTPNSFSFDRSDRVLYLGLYEYALDASPVNYRLVAYNIETDKLTTIKTIKGTTVNRLNVKSLD